MRLLAALRQRVRLEREGLAFWRFYGLRGALAEHRAGRLRYVGRGLFVHTPAWVASWNAERAWRGSL